MRIAVVTEQRIQRTSDGRFWNQVIPPSFWGRYLTVFDEVKIVARVEDVVSIPKGSYSIDHESVGVYAIPHYHGPGQFLGSALRVEQSLRRAVDVDEAVVMRIGSVLASRIEPVLRRRGQPYGVEVVGDPWDVFAPGSVDHLLRPILRRLFTRQVRTYCQRACAVGYVTEQALQRRYPPNPDGYSTHYSSIDLREEAYLSRPAVDAVSPGPTNLVFVGSLEQLYKAPDVLLKAVQISTARGLDLKLTVVGDGIYREQLQRLAQHLDIDDRVQFLGQLAAGEDVRSVLDRSDLFVLPSRTEGLPRAMIEAMARGLPCIGTSIGGIPELLPTDAMVEPGNVQALADVIQAAVESPAWMKKSSAENLSRAQAYRSDKIELRRTEMYRSLRTRTEEYHTSVVAS